MLQDDAKSTIKVRRGRSGAHLFDRTSGLNVLLEEIRFEPDRWHNGPRYVSIALTNACELSCPFCYAPKRPARLESDEVRRWALELDAAGTLGIGFGGGEPTAHPRFASICRTIAKDTALAVSFTTHGHRLTSELADELRGSVHFVRVSVDGIGETYERIRGRSFDALNEKIKLIASFAPFGINMVVTEETVNHLEATLNWAESVGAGEFLALAQQPAKGQPGLSTSARNQLTDWIAAPRRSIRMAVGEASADPAVGLADPFGSESPLEAHAHIDAFGTVRTDAFSSVGIAINDSVCEALHRLSQEQAT